MRLSSLMVLVATVALSGCAAAGPRDPEKVSTRTAVDVDLAAETRALASRVSAGMTLASLLQAAQIPAAEAAQIIGAVQSVFDPRDLHTDRPYRLVRTIAGALRYFEYEIDAHRFLRVTRPRSDRPWAVDVLPIPKTHTLAVVRGTIDREAPSLVAAVAAAGGTIDLAIALAGIFSGDIDFNTELQPGDTFALSVDKQFRDAGVFAGYGPIFAAEFENDGRRLRAVQFEASGRPPGYFDERGASMRRFMLRSPLKFDPVVTSGFSRRRMHPILGEYRAHLGVDYRAPAGAPVIAVANGVVVKAGMSGGAGRVVRLRHANGFETEYLHLSSTAVRAGARVRQGDVIGRVGATGLATGPHLDYRMKRNGVFINPVTALRSMPPADPVPAAEMPAFIAVRDRALAALPEPAIIPASGEAASP